MRDEEFVFMSDVREKKRTASGAFHKRTHAGKGGAIKFPSDYLSRKELKAMSGEVKSYNINNPMTWKEFKALPDDIKIVYIKLLREKFDAPDKQIAKMLGTHQQTFSGMVGQLGIRCGKYEKHKNFDADDWNAWLNGGKKNEEAEVEEIPVCETVIPAEEEAVEETVPVPVTAPKTVLVVPHCGSLNFNGEINAALDAVRQLLGCAVGELHVSWDLNSLNLKGRDAE